MSSIEVHCNDCIKKLGEPYRYVHEWLDQFASEYNGSKRHRKILHNDEGIEEVRKYWGNEAAEAARIHIERDRTENAFDFVKRFRLNR